DTGAILLLCLERGRVGSAVDVLVRHDRRGRPEICGVCGGSGEEPPGLKPPHGLRYVAEYLPRSARRRAHSLLASLACPNLCPSRPLRSRYPSAPCRRNRSFLARCDGATLPPLHEDFPKG